MAQDREKSVSKKNDGCSFRDAQQISIRVIGNPQSFEKSCIGENTTSLDKEDSSKMERAFWEGNRLRKSLSCLEGPLLWKREAI